MEYNARLKDLRSQFGLSITDVSEYLNISNNDLINLEKGTGKLTLSILIKLCDLYCVDEPYLLCKTNESKYNLEYPKIQGKDLKAIATVNRIYKNLMYLNRKAK